MFILFLAVLQEPLQTDEMMTFFFLGESRAEGLLAIDEKTWEIRLDGNIWRL